MVTIKQVDSSYFGQYDAIPMLVHVNSEYRLDKREKGLRGINFVETPVEPYIKDFRDVETESDVPWRKGWASKWDISNWAFLMAFDDEKPVGAATVVTRTEGVNMLCGRDDLAVLWDIRVADEYKRQGVGSALFEAAVEWSTAQGMTQLKIECQNNNVTAIKFYHSQGAVLGSIDEYAYFNDPDCKNEVQLVWYLNL
jgi:ribosomal protein S18 acetylase RimI-like enzyme